MKNMALCQQYWAGGAHYISIERMNLEWHGHPVVIRFGEYDKPYQPCFAAIAVAAENGFNKTLATGDGLGKVKAQAKKRCASPVPAPARPPVTRKAQAEWPEPNIAHALGVRPATLANAVERMAQREHQRRVASALAAQARRMAPAVRQRLIDQGIVSPA